MINLLRKQDQVQARIFGGDFHTNKPVVSGASRDLAPYSNLFYWSHAVAKNDVEFGLHPHEGWEIMTFVLAGENTHYDTATRTWTPLHTGDFQVIQAGSGLQHAEKIAKGTRSFQIWFDPDFSTSLQQTPAYTDYHANQLISVMEQGLSTLYYIGGNSPARATTQGLVIKQVSIPANTTQVLALNPVASQGVYVIQGSLTMAGFGLEENDALRVIQEAELRIQTSTATELFIIQTPLSPTYPVVWQ